MRNPLYTITLDYAFSFDLQEEMESDTNEYDLTPKILSNTGPGGWPEIQWKGTKENLVRFLNERYLDTDSYFASLIEKL